MKQLLKSRVKDNNTFCNQLRWHPFVGDYDLDSVTWLLLRATLLGGFNLSSLRPRRNVSFKYSFATLSSRAIYHSGRASRTSAKVSPLGSRLPSPPLAALFSRLKFKRPWVRDMILQTDSRFLKNSLITNSVKRKVRFFFFIYIRCAVYLISACDNPS